MILELALALALQQQPARPCPQPPPNSLAVVQTGRVTIEYEHDLWMEYGQLITARSLTPERQTRLAAITITLGTIPNRCTKGQAYAGLCVRVEDLRR